MLSFPLALATFIGLANGVSVASPSNESYVYIPIEFLYGADSRVTSNITFGSSNSITVAMDTGSVGAWIWQSGALVHWGSPYLFDPGPCNLTVPSSVTYNPGSSLTGNTQNQSSEYVYAGNSKIVQGSLYANDTLAFLSSNSNLTSSIPNVQLALENSAILRLRDNGSCSVAPSYDNGIIGLAPPYAHSNISQGPLFRANLLAASRTLSSIMVTWFNAPSNYLGTLSGGLLLGAIDTSKFSGPLVRVPNVTASGQLGYYLAKPTITFNGQTLAPDQNTTCLLDSGTHADYLPFDPLGILVGQFFNGSGGMLVNELDVVGWNGSCESIPRDLNISYSFGGFKEGEIAKIDVPLRNYARGATLQADASVCLLNLEVGGCTLGAPFYSGAVIAVDDTAGVLALAQGGVSKDGSGVDSSSLKILGVGETFEYV